ncbi:uncharacterized protein ISCGN_023373 [Ixodes scapularis]
MAELKPPGGLRLSEDTAENWKRFKQRMELYAIATATKEPRTKQQKAAIFLHVAGQEAIDVFNTFQLTADEKEDYDVLVQQFEDYCLPRVNETYERYVFRTRVQEPGEAFELFFRDLGCYVALFALPGDLEEGSDVNDTANADWMLTEENEINTQSAFAESLTSLPSP